MGFFHCIYYLIHCSLNSNLLESVIFFSPQWPCCVNPRVQSSFGVLLNPFLNNRRDLSYSHRHIYGKFLLLISFFFLSNKSLQNCHLLKLNEGVL